MAMRTTRRPMRPKPLTPSLISPDIMTGAVYAVVRGAKAASIFVYLTVHMKLIMRQSERGRRQGEGARRARLALV